MKNTLGRIILLVKDYEDALNFYEMNFGFKKIFDSTTDQGQRYLHIGTEPSGSFGIWLLKSDNNPHIGNQTNGQPTMVIYTSAIVELYEKLKSNNVTIKVEPVIAPAYKFFHCLDLYGNEIVIVEL